ncbi:30S ribosomal protein S8 [Acidimicrobiia bacterium EGI L10123]|jgi:small subunit ribosomal protein S8|uniref:30S ribosomal protein S8 n=1 Tax=Salinilacustrithrix flava TaxID=2957203 RepID=UPI003D7C322E|nr:30S ribosomal protein S8 [Acidimicrobiia bacterium EGI L10123]
MTMTDPIADMLTRVRNANTAKHDDVSMPSSKLKEALAELLKSEGYIQDFQTAERADKPGKILSIDMKYSPDRERTITGIKRVSKPGLRVYKKSDEIPRVLGGLGVAVLSTSQGLMTDREARRRNVGGEILCYVW